ncbi:hypothetical protein [Streptomyces eurythermus]
MEQDVLTGGPESLPAESEAAGEDGATAATPRCSGCCRWSASATG